MFFPGSSKEASLEKEIDLWQEKTEPYAGAKLTPIWRDLLAAARDRGWSGATNGELSGVRSQGEQGLLWKRFLRGKGAPAFPPGGPSRHLLQNIKRDGQWSQAVDVSRPGELVRIAQGLGVKLRQPYEDEPWHIEAAAPFAIPGSSYSLIGEERDTYDWILAFLMLSLLLVLVLRIKEHPQWRSLLLMGSLALLSFVFSSLPITFVLLIGVVLLGPFLVHSERTIIFYKRILSIKSRREKQRSVQEAQLPILGDTL